MAARRSSCSLSRRANDSAGSGPWKNADAAFAYQQAISRNPKKEEQKLLESLFTQHLAQYRADTKAAEELVQTGERPVAKDIDKAELAAWTSVARVVLNLSETITIY